MSSEKSTVQIILPNFKDIYSFLKLGKEDQQKVIELGLSALNLIEEKKSRYENTDFNDKLTQNEEKYKQIVQNMEKSLKEEKIKYSKLQADIYSRENEMQNKISRSIELEFKHKLKSKDDVIDTLKVENKKAQLKLNEITEKHFQQERDRIKSIYNDHEEKINTLSKENEEKINTLRKNYDEKISEIMNKMYKNEENSSVKGKLSENAMLQNLNMLFPKNTIEDTHKETARGDFIMTDENDNKILFENKDYQNNVPKKEIDKFTRDMTDNADICCGIFMSNASGICKKKDYQIEFILGKPVIYLHQTNKNINKIKCAYDIIQSILKTDIDFSNKELSDKFSKLSSEIKTKMSKCRKDIDKFTKSLLDNFLDIENMVKKIFSNLNIKK